MKRIGEELRCVELMALKGHGLSAISAAASIFEQAHQIMTVSGSKEDSLTLANSANPKKLAFSVKEFVNRSRTTTGWTDERAKEQYDLYSFLCGFKHNNPYYLRILNYPEADMWLGRFALSVSTELTLKAVGMIAAMAMSPQASETVLGQVNDVIALAEGIMPESIPIP